MYYQGQGQLSHHLAESGPELRTQMTATAAPLRAYRKQLQLTGHLTTLKLTTLTDGSSVSLPFAGDTARFYLHY